MFSTGLFTISVETAVSLLCFAVISTVFVMMSVSYTTKRHGEKYSKEKEAAPSLRSFKHLSKLLFVFSMLITMTSLLFDSQVFIAFHHLLWLKVLGTILVLFAFIRLKAAFTDLGDRYSPLFDAYFPDSLVINKSYRLIRHPIYTYNLLISLGLVITSGSLLVLLCFCTALSFILKAIKIEESCLQSRFDSYNEYRSRTWKLIPYIY